MESELTLSLSFAFAEPSVDPIVALSAMLLIASASMLVVLIEPPVELVVSMALACLALD